MSATVKFVLMAQPSAPAIPHHEVLERWAAELQAECEGLEVVFGADELAGEPLRYVVADKVLGF